MLSNYDAYNTLETKMIYGSGNKHDLDDQMTSLFRHKT